MLMSLRSTFSDYCMSIGTAVEHPVVHVYT